MKFSKLTEKLEYPDGNIKNVKMSDNWDGVCTLNGGIAVKSDDNIRIKNSKGTIVLSKEEIKK